MREEEFLTLYDAYADAIFRHCYFRVYERERARDLVQEAFVRTWEYAAGGNVIENARAFLYRVANNLIIDEARKKKALSLDALREEGFDPRDPRENAVIKNAEVQEILRLLQTMDESTRHLVTLRFVDGFGPKEIAAVLGETENAVSVRLHRTMAMLRKIINAE